MKFFPFALTAFFVAVWFLIEADLVNVIVIFVLVVMAIYYLWRFVKSKNGSYIFPVALNVVLFGVGLCLRAHVISEVDVYVASLINANHCRPVIDELKKKDPQWENISPKMAQIVFKKLGATRKIIYQETGLLRYGFPLSEEKVYKFKECKN